MIAGVSGKLLAAITRPTPTLRSDVVSANALRSPLAGPPNSQPATTLANTKSDIPAYARRDAGQNSELRGQNETHDRQIEGQADAICRLLKSRREDRLPVPHRDSDAQGNELQDEERDDQFDGVDLERFHVRHERQQATQQQGRHGADEAARRAISPTDAPAFPLAIVVQGGPNGAPGQTARIRKPAETIGSA